ncbi:hypothetical protein [Asaia bogorensis]|uniref:hypothetical protein n=1 Tax=Asaia bogorensis TaxID=91915 RepID=UPI000EFC5515|nr:hypothetical protein [Asaia bogorensis]
MQLFMDKMRLECPKLDLSVAKFTLGIFSAPLLQSKEVAQTVHFFSVVIAWGSGYTLRRARALMMFNNDLPFLNEATAAWLAGRFRMHSVIRALPVIGPQTLQRETQGILADLALRTFIFTWQIRVHVHFILSGTKILTKQLP